MAPCLGQPHLIFGIYRMRISEAKQAVGTEVDWQENTLEIHAVKVRSGHDQNVTRKIPLNPALKQLLGQLQHKHNPKPTDRICKVSECQRSLDRACKPAECKRLTHHDLRYYFVTKCLQPGVNGFTLAKWVGHRDNGKLLLKVYSHLQAEHSQAMATKVTFGASMRTEPRSRPHTRQRAQLVGHKLFERVVRHNTKLTAIFHVLQMSIQTQPEKRGAVGYRHADHILAVGDHSRDIGIGPGGRKLFSLLQNKAG
jgi:hypothetical protein